VVPTIRQEQQGDGKLPSRGERGRVGAVGKRRPNANLGMTTKVIGSDAPTNAELKHAKSALWLSLRCECAMKPYEANLLE